MSARVLIVDDLPTNVKVLEAKLTAEYFTVMTAQSGAEALERVRDEAPDVILLDVMMPEMDGFEVCRRLKADAETAHIPVVMVTALSDVSDRVTGLECGADDFLTKPVNDLTLFARVRSLARMKRAMDEWRLREDTCEQFGAIAGETPADAEAAAGTILVVEPDEFSGERFAALLEEEGHTVTCLPTAARAVELAQAQDFDLAISSLYLDDSDGLRLCSELRAVERCRTLPTLLVIEAEEIGGLVKGFELGINDYLVRPVDANELKARTRTQLRQKRYRDRLQQTYQRSLSMALTDGLTGLYNQRYLNAHLQAAIRRAGANNKPLSLLMIDIDHFKKVNDTHGHAVGDRVLQELGRRMVRNLREFDMAARLGGEEFVVVMPECEPEIAAKVAERLRNVIAREPFEVGAKAGKLEVTASLGVACTEGPDDTPEALLARADETMYAAKRGGRNRVEVPPGLASPRMAAAGAR